MLEAKSQHFMHECMRDLMPTRPTTLGHFFWLRMKLQRLGHAANAPDGIGSGCWEFFFWTWQKLEILIFMHMRCMHVGSRTMQWVRDGQWALPTAGIQPLAGLGGSKFGNRWAPKC